eukprot:CAMPEP_0194305048 /NCGR_PEP_ID=MMETSP0171-20130528/2578_1 /TAXON_ID=218684 /ORGANISM="Corethron pennatum, Strain L29A3" /LENGTH=139 /DNA_ID=CAMNT_0039056459 /DNA_START=663 /DNA_END=1082 /DNA_ORIENTATION=-
MNSISANGGGAAQRSRSRRHYRSLLDAAEDATIRSGDVVRVNSEFTREQFRSVLSPSHIGGVDIMVLHLCVRMNGPAPDPLYPSAPVVLIVSLNRFERKKDAGLLLCAAVALQRAPRPSPRYGGGGTPAAQHGHQSSSL